MGNEIVLPPFTSNQNFLIPNQQHQAEVSQQSQLAIFLKPNPPKIISTNQLSSQNQFIVNQPHQQSPTVHNMSSIISAPSGDQIYQQSMQDLISDEMVTNIIPRSVCSSDSANNTEMYMYRVADNDEVIQNENVQFRIVNESLPNNNGGYSMNGNGMLQISDAVFQQPIPTNLNTTDQMLQIQLNMAYKLSKLESRVANLDGMLEKIFKVLSAGGRPVTQNSEVSKEPNEENCVDAFTKISSIAELDALEIKLANRQFKNASVSVFILHLILSSFDHFH